MRKSLIALAAVAAFGMSFTTVRAEDAKKMEMTGVLIDNHCGEEMVKKEGATAADIQKAAEGHKKGCLMKCAKDDKSVSLMSEGKMMKLDTASAEKAMTYLEGKGKTKVMVEASKNDDGTLALAEIKPAKEEKKTEETK